MTGGEKVRSVRKLRRRGQKGGSFRQGRESGYGDCLEAPSPDGGGVFSLGSRVSWVASHSCSRRGPGGGQMRGRRFSLPWI